MIEHHPTHGPSPIDPIPLMSLSHLCDDHCLVGGSQTSSTADELTCLTRSALAPDQRALSNREGSEELIADIEEQLFYNQHPANTASGWMRRAGREPSL
jgi:hypothetical protein